VRTLCLLITAALPATIAFAQPENLVTNPSFEEVGDNGAPVDWSPYNWDRGGEMVLDTAIARTGSNSGRVDAESDAERGIWRTFVAIGDLKTMQVSAWYRSDVSAGQEPHGPVMRLIWLGDGPGWDEISANYLNAPLSEDWRQVRGLVAVPEGASRLAIELFNWDAKGSVWWDDVVARALSDEEEMEIASELADALERPRGEYEVFRSPRDGETLGVTPPVFVWLPVDGVNEYIVQYSPDPRFESGETVTMTSAQTMQALHEPLSPGQWYWRFGYDAGGAAGRVFGDTRAFTIAPDAVEMPFPDIEALVTRIADSGRPRILVSGSELPALREKASEEHPDVLQRLIGGLDGRIGEDLLPEPEFLPESGIERTRAYQRIMVDTRGIIGLMDRFATAYLLTGEEKYGLEAKRRLMHVVSWDPEGSTALYNHDEPGTQIVRICPRTYDYIYDLLSEEDRQRCQDCFAIRMPQLYRQLKNTPFEVHPYSSHPAGYYLGDLTESCIAMAGDIDVAPWLEYALKLLMAPFFPPFAGRDGGWAEGPSYWQWTTSRISRVYRVVEHATGIPINQREWLRNTGYFKLYCNPPYSDLSPFGDGQEGHASGAPTMWELAKLFDDPYLMWWADYQGYNPSGLEALLLDEPTVEPKAPSDLPDGRCFDSIGLACMHSDLASEAENVHVMMRSSPFGAISHAYADQNAFICQAYGEPLAIASGYYQLYGSPHHSAWTWHTKASNSIGVNGEGQQIRNWNSNGRIVQFESDEAFHYALGDATPAYMGRLTRFYRHIFYVRPSAEAPVPVIVIYDDLRAPEPSTYDWWLHALDEMAVDSDAQHVLISHGEAKLHVQFLTPGDLTFSQTDRFPEPPEREGTPNQWHLTASTTDSREQCRFITVLVPMRTGDLRRPEVQLLQDDTLIGARVRVGDVEQLVAFRADSSTDQPLVVGGVTADADVFAVTRDAAGDVLQAASVNWDW